MLIYLYPLRMTPHRLVATDIVHAISLAIVPGLGYLIAGKVDLAMLLSLLAGSLPAVVTGNVPTGKLKGGWVQITPGFVLLRVGLKVLV